MSRPSGREARGGLPLGRLGLLLAGVAALFVLDLAFGSVRLPFAEAARALVGRSENPAWNAIVQVFRLPKAVTALVGGAALAVSGLVLQTVFRNPLAGPDSLGIGAGASLGVGLVIVLAGGSSSTLVAELGLGGYATLAFAAALGALAVLLVILALSRRVEHGVTLLIVGLLVGYLAGSLVSLLVWFGSPQKVQLFLSWTYGSFSSVTIDRLPVLLGGVAAGFLLVAGSSKALDALLLGERYAETLGVRARPARTRVLLAAAILAGTVTAFCGPVAILGIAAPQAARRFFKSSAHATLVPGAALFGSLFALGADVASAAPGGGALLPLNPLLALIGAPIILSIFLRDSREEAGA